MNRRKFLAAGTAIVASAAMATAAPTRRANLGLLIYSYGIRARAEKDQGFSDPIKFLEFAHQRGANAVQLSLGIRTDAEGTAIRQACDRLEMHLEGIVSPPKDDADVDRFSRELASVRACGVEIVRTVMLGGRRYEVFDKAADFPAFAKTSEEMLHRADRIAQQHKVALAVENHKDYRADEMADLLKRISSEWIGVCLDTGNNLALLDDPMSTVETLAPWTRTVHLKDIGVEPADDGFRMAEVPLGKGFFELKRMIATVRQFNAKARFNLEMMTRDPLSIPCLTDKYWATLGQVPGKDLARTLKLVRQSARLEPLPRITALSQDDQLAAEERHVRESFEYMNTLG